MTMVPAILLLGCVLQVRGLGSRSKPRIAHIALSSYAVTVLLAACPFAAGPAVGSLVDAAARRLDYLLPWP